MDNNFAEQAIRPFIIGQKNFVIIESDNGANVNAMLYSLAETAKANHINTYQYFEILLTEIPKHMNDKDLSFLDNLMPSLLVSRRSVLAFSKNHNSNVKVQCMEIAGNMAVSFYVVLMIERLPSTGVRSSEDAML